MFSQILKLIPRIDFERIVKETGAEYRSKGLSSWSQFVAMLFCQLDEAATRRIRRPRLGYTNTRFEASEWQGLSWRALRPVAILQTVSSASVGLRFLDCPPGTLCLRDIVTAVLDKVERLHCRSSRATKTA